METGAEQAGMETGRYVEDVDFFAVKTYGY